VLFFAYVLVGALWSIFTFSITLFIFNLIPVFPLDGFRVVEAFNKTKGKIYQFLRGPAIYIFLGLILWSVICDYLRFPQYDILSIFIGFMTNIIGYPIRAFWGLFGL